MIRLLRHLATLAVLLALAVTALALPASAGTRWDGTRWDTATADCLPTNRAALTHTFTGHRLTVTVKPGARLCTPLTVTLASYRYDGPTKYPQTLADHQTLTLDHGTGLLVTEELCGQQEAILGLAPARLTNDRQLRFLHEVSEGTFPSYSHQPVGSCAPVPTPTPVVTPTPSETPPVPAVVAPPVSQSPPATTPRQIAVQAAPVPAAAELPATGPGRDLLVVFLVAMNLIGWGALALSFGRGVSDGLWARRVARRRV